MQNKTLPILLMYGSGTSCHVNGAQFIQTTNTTKALKYLDEGLLQGDAHAPTAIATKKTLGIAIDSLIKSEKKTMSDSLAQQ